MGKIIYYHVKSATKKGRTYEVWHDPEKRGWKCPCLGFVYRGNCTHITTAKKGNHSRIERIREVEGGDTT